MVFSLSYILFSLWNDIIWDGKSGQKKEDVIPSWKPRLISYTSQTANVFLPLLFLLLLCLWVRYLIIVLVVFCILGSYAHTLNYGSCQWLHTLLFYLPIFYCGSVRDHTLEVPKLKEALTWWQKGVILSINTHPSLTRLTLYYWTKSLK